MGWVVVVIPPDSQFDLCSPACLAKQAVLDAIELGAQQNHEAVQSKLAAAPVKVRKWWNR